MPQPLPTEELQRLDAELPNFRESPKLQYLADRKLLPQQNDTESFESPALLTAMRRKVFGLTRKEQQLIKRQQEALVPFEQEQEIKTKLQVMQDFAQANAPTYEQASRRGIGLPPPMRSVEEYGPGAPIPSGLQPGTGFTQEELAQPTPLYSSLGEGLKSLSDTQVGPFVKEGPRPMGQAPDVNARLSPVDLQLYQNVVGGHGVMEDGQYIPAFQAKPRTDLMSPEQVVEQVKFNRSLRNIDDDSASGLLTAPPTMDLPRATVQAGLSDAARRTAESARQQGTHSLDDMAVAVTGMGLAQLPPDATVTPAYRQRIAQLVPGMDVPVGTNVRQAIAGMKAVAVPKMLANERAFGMQSAIQAQPLPTEKRSNLYSRKEFADEGLLLPPQAGISLGEASRKDFVEITDTQRHEYENIQRSREQLRTAMSLVDPLVTATNPAQVALQAAKLYAGAYSRANPEAATYLDTKEALANTFARVMGSEVGVLTNVDVKRWENTLPGFGDTVAIRDQKKQLLGTLRDLAEQAYRVKIAGGDFGKIASRIEKTFTALESVAGSPARTPSPKDIDAKLDKLIEELSRTGK